MYVSGISSAPAPAPAPPPPRCDNTSLITQLVQSIWPSGPELLHAGEDRPWIPQGQGHDAGRQQILTSYNDGGQNVLLSIQDQQCGAESAQVILGGGYARNRNFWTPPPDKGGGVATDGRHVYLADTEAIYVYRRDDIDRTADGESVAPTWIYPMPTEQNASYITVQDGKAYVGQFAVDPQGYGSDEDKAQYDGAPSLVRLDVGEDGWLSNPSAPIRTPYYAQGVAVTDAGLLYTTSFGSDDDSPRQLMFQAFQGEPSRMAVQDPALSRAVYQLDPYAEELNIIGGQVWVTYESAADKYRGNVEVPRSRIQRIDWGALDLPAG